tara:strand:- start:301 stop:459 length:159 start_codon:yes stop_codon:yes gene_type:complete
VAEERTTGERTVEKVNYTKLNFSRSKRLDKTITFSEVQNQYFKYLKESKPGW